MQFVTAKNLASLGQIPEAKAAVMPGGYIEPAAPLAKVWSVAEPVQPPPLRHRWTKGRRAPYGGKGMPVPYEWTATPIFRRAAAIPTEKWLFLGGLVTFGIVLWLIGSELSK